MIDTEVPHAGVDHAVAGKGHNSANDGAGKTVVPVVELVDRESAGDKGGAQDRRVDGDELPHRWVVVAPDLEFGIEVEIQEDEACECGGGVA